MSDYEELVQRLLQPGDVVLKDDLHACADAIVQLQALVAELEKGCDTITTSAMASYKRAERAEAELAEARELLLYIRNTMCKPWGDPMMQRINTALAEIKK